MIAPRSGSLHLLFALAILLASRPTYTSAQVSAGPTQPAVQQPQLPITTQIKKTIVFLESDCFHDFDRDAASLTPDKVMQMQPAQQQAILGQLRMLAARLLSVAPSRGHLSAEEISRLNNPSLETPADEIEWRLQLIAKMTQLTDSEIAKLTDADFAMMPLDQHRGTGFLVGYPDSRLNLRPGDPPRYFRYLVTNRHVVQPGIENGAPCRVIRFVLLSNHKPDSTHAGNYTEVIRLDPAPKWVFPTDDSVDLAVTGVGFDEKQYDQLLVPTSQFASDDDIRAHRIVEGDPVVFAGLFIQTFDQDHALEPIVRSGTLAMVPDGLLQTTLNKKMGHIFLTEAHVFAGNSGSPLFVDQDKFSGVIGGYSYKLLGVISGEVFENSDLTLNVTASLSANIAANSDVSVVVPATELMKLLDDPALQAERDRVVQAQTSTIPKPTP